MNPKLSRLWIPLEYNVSTKGGERGSNSAMHAPVCACGQSLHKMVQYHLINLCMERLRGPQLPIHPYSTKDLEKKKAFWGYLVFIRSPIIRGKS